MNYSDKLKDPRWQRKRLEIFQRDGFKCVVCKNDTITLHVHHKRYNGKNPWDINNEFLVTVCEICHGRQHNQPGFIDKQNKMRPFLRELSALTDDELEIFVRKRLGQRYPEPEIEHITETFSLKKHLRFNFHAATSKEKENNYHILSLFDDVFGTDGDHLHSPSIHSYKGSIWIGDGWLYEDYPGNRDRNIDYTGWGTVSIIKDLIKRSIRGQFPLINGHL